MSEPVVLSGSGLQIRFEFVGDRFVHSIAAVNQQDDEQVVPLATSEEGTDEQDWPASPAFQELHLQEVDTRPLAMLVGATTSGHFSLAVDFDPATGRAVFDAACRVKKSPAETPRLGSTYRTMVAPQRVVPGPVDGFSPGSEAARLQLGDVSLRVQMEPVEAARDEGEAQDSMVLTEAGLTIAPAISSVDYPYTFRWRYVVERLG